MTVLVTGWRPGFIGSHTCVELLNNGFDIIVMDNYVNSSPDALRAVEKITGKTFPIYECDMLDYDNFEKIFKENKIDAVIHFAGLKAVGEPSRSRWSIITTTSRAPCTCSTSCANTM